MKTHSILMFCFSLKRFEQIFAAHHGETDDDDDYYY